MSAAFSDGRVGCRILFSSLRSLICLRIIVLKIRKSAYLLLLLFHHIAHCNFAFCLYFKSMVAVSLIYELYDVLMFSELSLFAFPIR